MNKHRNWFGYLFLFVVGSLIVTFLVSPNSFDNFKQNVKNIMPSGKIIQQDSNLLDNAQKDSLLSKCEISFRMCEEISEQKYGFSVSLIKIEKFEEKTKADEFYNTWKSPFGQIGLDYELTGSFNQNLDDYMPVVLFASKITSQQGQIPVVLICDKDGNLMSMSKKQLLCG